MNTWVVVCVKAGLATEARTFHNRTDAVGWLRSIGARRSDLDGCWYGEGPLHYYWLHKAIPQE